MRNLILKIVFGVFFIAMGFVFGVFIRGENKVTEANLKRTLPLKVSEVGLLKSGEFILLEATLSEDNPLLIHDFVLSCREQYVKIRSGDDYRHEWQVSKKYTQDLILKVKNDFQATLTGSFDCPTHNFITFENPNEKYVRYIGYKRGTTITAMGAVKVSDGLVIDNAQLTAMTRQEWIENVESSKTMLLVLGVAFMCIGVLLIIWAFKYFSQLYIVTLICPN